jgi:hypothetical protein
MGVRRYGSYSYLTSALDGGEWSASRPGRASPPGKGPPVPIGQETGWAPEPVWTQGLEEKSSAPVGDRTPIVQSVVRHYTDWATAAPVQIKLHKIFSVLCKNKTPLNQCYKSEHKILTMTFIYLSFYLWLLCTVITDNGAETTIWFTFRPTIFLLFNAILYRYPKMMYTHYNTEYSPCLYTSFFLGHTVYEFETVGMFVCMFAHTTRRNMPICTKLGMLISWDQEENTGGSKPRKSVLSLNPVRAVPVARKLSTIEERRQDQSCLFRRGDYRNKGQKPEKLSWVRVLEKMSSLEIIFSMIFNDTYQMIRSMINFRAIKTDKSCKHLSNFPTIRLRDLC